MYGHVQQLQRAKQSVLFTNHIKPRMLLHVNAEAKR